VRFPFTALLLVTVLLSACGETVAPQPPLPPLKITRVESTDVPIEAGKAFPDFHPHFEEGVSVIYTYVWLENAQFMTGAFMVRMRWFSPNDFRPPIAQHEIEVQPGQDIAQFSVHNEDGMNPGPYQLIARAGKDASSLTASGSSRFFIGMTEEEAEEFLTEEDTFRKARDEKRAKQKEEQAKAQKEEDMDALEKISGGEDIKEEEIPPASADELRRSDDPTSADKDEEPSEPSMLEVEGELPPSLTSGSKE